MNPFAIPGGKTVIAFIASTVAAALIGISIGWKFIGYPRGFQAGEAASHTINDALNTVAVDTMRGKLACVAEVTKSNNEVDRQKEENRKILNEDRAATSLAVERAEKAAAAAAASATRTQLQIAEARDEMVKIKDACVNAGVPAALFDVLNRTMETQADPIRSAPGGQVSGASAGN